MRPSIIALTALLFIFSNKTIAADFAPVLPMEVYNMSFDDVPVGTTVQSGAFAYAGLMQGGWRVIQPGLSGTVADRCGASCDGHGQVLYPTAIIPGGLGFTVFFNNGQNNIKRVEFDVIDTYFSEFSKLPNYQNSYNVTYVQAVYSKVTSPGVNEPYVTVWIGNKISGSQRFSVDIPDGKILNALNVSGGQLGPAYLLIDNMTIYKNQLPGSLDLKVDSISIPGSQKTQVEDQQYIQPNKDYNIQVQVSGTGLNNPESRTTEVQLFIDNSSTPAAVQSLNLSSLSSTGTTMVNFPVNRTTVQTGKLDLKVVLNPSNSPTETDLNNNQNSQKFYVLCKVEEIKNRNKVQFWSQAELPWGAKDFGIVANSKNPGTMTKWGCSTTSFAMLANYYGIFRAPQGAPSTPFVPVGPNLEGLGGESLNPGTLNAAFTNFKRNLSSQRSVALNNANDPDWMGMAEVARAGYKAQCNLKIEACDPSQLSSIITLGKKDYFSTFDDTPDSADHRKVEAELCQGNPVILKLLKPNKKEPAKPGQHFVLATGIEVDSSGNKTYRVNNPGIPLGEEQLRPSLAPTYTNIIGYVRYTSSADPSMMNITAPLNVHFVVVDPLGRRSGYNPNTNTTYNEIPGTSYELQSINNPGDDGSDNDTQAEERYFSYADDKDIPVGNYSVQVYGVTAGSYYLDYAGYDSKGNSNAYVYKTGTITAGGTITENIIHSADSIPEVTAILKLEEYEIKKKPKNNYSQSRIKIEGRITNLDKSKLVLENQFKLLIGGVSGYSLSIPASEFKHRKYKSGFTALYKSRSIEVEISSSGEFEINLEKADLSSLTKDQFNYVGVQVDDKFADVNQSLQCRKNACKLPKHGRCHFDKEDEE